MTSNRLASSALKRLGGVYVATMLLITAGGVKATRDPLVIMVGKPTDVRWRNSCSCSEALFRISAVRNVRLMADGGDLLNVDGYVVVIGQLRSDELTYVLSADRIVKLRAIDTNAMQIIRWLHAHRPIAIVALLLLAAYGWEAISATVAILVAGAACVAAAALLDAMAFCLGIGLPDLAWAATLTATGSAGWYVARHFEPVLEGKAQSLVVSFASALLFRDMVGVLGGMAGVALPALSKRIALAFLVAVAASIALELSDTVVQLVAGISFALACVDRWHLMTISPADAGASDLRKGLAN